MAHLLFFSQMKIEKGEIRTTSDLSRTGVVHVPPELIALRLLRDERHLSSIPLEFDAVSHVELVVCLT